MNYRNLEREAWRELLRLCGPAHSLPLFLVRGHLCRRFSLSWPDTDMLLQQMEVNGQVRVGSSKVWVIV